MSVVQANPAGREKRTVKASFELDRETWRALRLSSIHSSRSASDIIRELIDRHLAERANHDE